MKRDNDFYYFLSYITFYTILLIWYTYYITNYDEIKMPDYATRSFSEHTFVDFFFNVVLAFPFGIISWFNQAPLNIIFYYLGALLYSFLFYKVYYKKIGNVLSIMVLLNVMAIIFLFAFFLENPLAIAEARR
jgi:hypothetical protein